MKRLCRIGIWFFILHSSFFILFITSVRYKESLRELSSLLALLAKKSNKSSQILQIWMRFRVILNRFVGFGYAELKVLPRRGTTKELILLYRTHVFLRFYKFIPSISLNFSFDYSEISSPQRFSSEPSVTSWIPKQASINPHMRFWKSPKTIQ